MDGLEEWLPLVREGEHRNRLTNRAGSYHRHLRFARVFVGLGPLFYRTGSVLFQGGHCGARGKSGHAQSAEGLGKPLLVRKQLAQIFAPVFATEVLVDELGFRRFGVSAANCFDGDGLGDAFGGEVAQNTLPAKSLIIQP